MNSKSLLFFCLTLSVVFGHTQTIIQMEKVGGVYQIPCIVNGLKLKFIFDTGASDVTLSLTEALFMLKNGYLEQKDFLGTEYYRIANGDIQEGTTVNLRSLEVGGQKIYNIQASISHTLDAPLLFGQTALQRFGKFSIDYASNKLILGNTGTSNSTATKENLPPSLLANEINENDYGGILYGEKRDNISVNGKKVDFTLDKTTLIKNAFTTSLNNLNMGAIKLDKVVYIFDEQNVFYAVFLQGSFKQAELMKSILNTKFGDYDHENSYDNIHITQWVFKGLTITMKVIDDLRFEIRTENFKG